MEKGAYIWVCYWCGRDIHNAYKVAWFEEDPDERWQVFHWNRCLKQYEAENAGMVILSRGMPAFRLYVPFMGTPIELGTE